MVHTNNTQDWLAVSTSDRKVAFWVVCLKWSHCGKELTLQRDDLQSCQNYADRSIVRKSYKVFEF